MQKLAFCFSILFYFSCTNSNQRQSQVIQSIKRAHADTTSYEIFKNNIDSSRKNFRSFYLNCPNRNDVKDSFKKFMAELIGNEMVTYWKGTTYDFNGTTTIPKQGGIACGYFVTGVLKDAGVKINRRKLSICPSLTMMKALTSSRQIDNLSHLDYQQFSKYVEEGGLGVYVVGLDFHTGFIVNDGLNTWFIHSNYINKQGVVKEKLTGSLALKSSKTRFLTCLTNSDEFLNRWLFN